jgi:hypothetical protein
MFEIPSSRKRTFTVTREYALEKLEKANFETNLSNVAN